MAEENAPSTGAPEWPYSAEETAAAIQAAHQMYHEGFPIESPSPDFHLPLAMLTGVTARVLLESMHGHLAGRDHQLVMDAVGRLKKRVEDKRWPRKREKMDPKTGLQFVQMLTSMASLFLGH